MHNMNTSTLDRIKALQVKAANIQAAVNACDGHIWGNIYISEIDSIQGSSAACIRCGERRSLDKIGQDEKRQYGER